jgi:sugar lactone lactonase YvrE
MAFDGANLWVTTAQTEGNGAVHKIRASDGKSLGIFTVGPYPISTAFDGANIWVVNGGKGANGTVTKLRANDGKLLGTFNVQGAPTGIAFDGTNMWVANRGYGTVSKLRARDGKLLGNFSVAGAPYGVAFDGIHIWVSADQGLTELLASDGKTLHFYYTPVSQTSGIVFTGTNVWAAGWNNNAAGKFGDF